MFKYLLALVIFVYIWLIAEKVFEIRKIDSCINTLCDFVNSAAPSSNGTVNKKENFNLCLAKVLKKYPDISEFTSYCSPLLSYCKLDDTNYKNSIEIYFELLMKRNYLLKELKGSLNPAGAIKLVVSFPSLIIKFMGFAPKDTFSNFLNLLGWMLTYVLSLYSEEIKTLISGLLKSL